MRIRSRKYSLILLILLLCMILSACTGNIGNAGTQIQTQTAAQSTSGSDSAQSGTSDPVTVEYDQDDLNASIDADAAKIELKGDSITADASGVKVDGSTVTITSAGTYSISGTLNDGQIVVDTKDDKTVRLILNGVSVSCSDSSAIYVANAEKTVITLAEGTENTIRDGSSYVFTEQDTDEPNGAIFSHDDLTVNGSGSLNVQGNYQHGIVSKDDLKIVSGTITVKSVTDGLKGRDLVAVKDGSITVNAGSDGIKSNNDEDEGKGVVVIENGKITIQAGDDGIHAETSLHIEGGDIKITESYEGIESAAIDIDGGNIEIKSSDDGINVAGGKDSFSSSGTYTLNIDGGSVYVDADGDGIDVNGGITMTGGLVLVNGPTANNNGALDYDSGFKISGGILVAAGSVGMALAPDESSTQYSLSVNLTSALETGTLFHIESGKGDEIVTFVPTKQYQSIVVSSPAIKDGETYLVYTGGSSSGTEMNGLYTGGTYTKGTQSASITVTGIVTVEGQGGMTGPGGGNRSGGRSGGSFVPGQNGSH